MGRGGTRNQTERRRPSRILGRVVSRVRKSAGSSPGTLVHTGERKTERVFARYLDYDAEHVAEGALEGRRWPAGLSEPPTVSWVDVVGLHDLEPLEAVGGHFELHPLMLEDVASPRQRPKLEEYDNGLFIVLKACTFDAAAGSVEIDQISLVLGRNWVLSFQERECDALEPVRERILQAKGKICARGPDYLAYAIMDAIVDGYFEVLEQVADETEELEELVLGEPSAEVMERVHCLKREILVLRKAIWPLRDVLGSLYRNESAFIEDRTRVFLRDVYDHCVQIVDAIDTFRELLSGTMDLYLSSVSNRMNEVMKVLTVIATIFIPLSFFAGVYGMNFRYMPELAVPWAYPAVLALMAALACGMLWYFRRKRWI